MYGESVGGVRVSSYQRAGLDGISQIGEDGENGKVMVLGTSGPAYMQSMVIVR